LREPLMIALRAIEPVSIKELILERADSFRNVASGLRSSKTLKAAATSGLLSFFLDILFFK